MKNRIREIRLERGISQDALAKEIGRQKALVSKLENGKIKLSQQYLELLAQALRCAPADLLGPPAFTKTAKGAKDKTLAKRPMTFEDMMQMKRLQRVNQPSLTYSAKTSRTVSDAVQFRVFRAENSRPPSASIMAEISSSTVGHSSGTTELS